jgi:two-component system sensor histidine kinase KdpD
MLLERYPSTPIARLRHALPDWRYVDALAAVGILAAATGTMLLIRAHLNVLTVSLIFLIIVIGIALVADRWTSIAASGLAFLLFDFFFILPYHTLTVAAPDHALGLAVFLGVAALTSQLIYRVRIRTVEALQRGRQMETLYELSRTLIADVALEPMLTTIVHRVAHIFGVASCAILLPDERGQPVVRVSIGQPPPLDDRDDAALVAWVFEYRQTAGIGNSAGRITLPNAGRNGAGEMPARWQRPRPKPPTLYVPIATASHTIGVLRVAQPMTGPRFSIEQQQLLTTFANQAALALERVRLADEATRASVLARSDELKSALLSAVSHDLRTPLASIKTSVTGLLQEDIHWPPDEERDLLMAIDEETDRLTRIVGNLLDLTRIEAGVLRPQLAWNDIEELVAETVERARASIRHHPIAVEIAAGMPPARFDYVQVAQVLMNLLENAAKYAPEGSGITVTARSTPGAIEVSVADRGCGIPPGEEERIFDTFYRLPQHPHAAGAGVGLSICRGIVTAHGGRIWVEPREGGGSIFRFSLPAEPRAMEAEV